jgi:hypothetical protein
MSNKTKGGQMTGAKGARRVPRGVDETIGRREGTPPKAARGKDKKPKGGKS